MIQIISIYASQHSRLQNTMVAFALGRGRTETANVHLIICRGVNITDSFLVFFNGAIIALEAMGKQ